MEPPVDMIPCNGPLKRQAKSVSLLKKTEPSDSRSVLIQCIINPILPVCSKRRSI
jgi:hypothetical protein